MGHGFLGITSILLFWAALIRATRDWGGVDGQGRAFGILDGGRGLFAALLTMAAVWLFAAVMPSEPQFATARQKEEALGLIIYGYTAFTGLAGILAFMAIPSGPSQRRTRIGKAFEKPSLATSLVLVLKRPTIWLQAAIVICAYVGYKGTDYYSLFAADVYGMDAVRAAQVGAISAWVRPIAALMAGLLADRLRSSIVITVCFSIALAVFSYMGLATVRVDIAWLLFTEVAIGCIAIFGLRGVYFALFEEAKLPIAVTGSAVGVVSVIGYTPDIFVGPIAGYLLDTYPGADGHQYLMIFVASFAFVGLSASMAFMRLTSATCS